MTSASHEALERHEQAHAHAHDGHGRRAGVIIGVLAAVLAICEMQERSAQSAYLAHGIEASDDYAFYQARQVRATILAQSAALLDAQPQSPATAKAASDARAESKRLIEDTSQGNSSKQLVAKAKAVEAARDEALHRYEWFEIVTSALQIAIVLGSVSVVAGVTGMLWGAIAIGAGAALLSGAVAAGLV